MGGDSPGQGGEGPLGPAVGEWLRCPAAAFGKPVCRLGLATRGGAHLSADDVLAAVGQGVNFLNWPGVADAPGGADGLSEAVASLGSSRDQVAVSVQFGARSASEARDELRAVLTTLRTDYIDVLTFYYVENASEWQEIAGAGGALEYCRAARREGVVRRLGLTSHQRSLAAEIARGGQLDTLMIRYNAAHRGAEREVFPVTDARGMPVITYTGLRWGALLRPTPDDPPGCVVPPAPWWYRFVLQSPSVAVALAAPENVEELREDLEVLRAAAPLTPEEYARLGEHGERVRRHAGRFP
jgi:predicted aldo/keto reductase-like oxidoreductase